MPSDTNLFTGMFTWSKVNLIPKTFSILFKISIPNIIIKGKVELLTFHELVDINIDNTSRNESYSLIN